VLDLRADGEQVSVNTVAPNHAPGVPAAGQETSHSLTRQGKRPGPTDKGAPPFNAVARTFCGPVT